jgi:hypothetical protein
MGTKSRESIYGSSIRASVERAAEARKQHVISSMTKITQAVRSCAQMSWDDVDCAYDEKPRARQREKIDASNPFGRPVCCRV